LPPCALIYVAKKRSERMEQRRALERLFCDTKKVWFEILKPSAPVWAHAMVAGIIWTLVGTLLVCKGIRILLFDNSHLIALALSLCAGCAKAAFVLDKAANRSVIRMLEKGDGSCIGGFFSLKTWLMIAVMMLMGRLLSASDLPDILKGVILSTIGSALIISSRIFWLTFSRLRNKLKRN